MPLVKTLAFAGLAVIGLASAAHAKDWFVIEPMMWKSVRAYPGEDAWSACRRHFRYNVARVAYGPAGTVSCYVPYHYIYSPDQIRKNFNR